MKRLLLSFFLLIGLAVPSQAATNVNDDRTGTHVIQSNNNVGGDLTVSGTIDSYPGSSDVQMIYSDGKGTSNSNVQGSTSLVTYNGNQYAGFWDDGTVNGYLTLCKRVSDAVAWSCTVYNGTPKAATFSGSGLNDATSGGTFTGTATATYEVTIDATGTPDTFKWRKDGGSYTSGVAITGAAQTLNNGVQITFGATTGHTLNDTWTIVTNARIQGGSTDVHENVSLGFDSNGLLHVSYGSYVLYGGLDYTRAVSVESVDGLIATEQTISATYDSQASYVNFFNDSSMNLFCFYRSNGMSGNADTFMFKYNTGTATWAAATGTEAGGRFINGSDFTLNAYVGHPYVDSSDVAHFTATWRNNVGGVHSEKAFYFKYDMVGGAFYKANGTAQTIPITTSNDDEIDQSATVDANLEDMQYRYGVTKDSNGRLHAVISKDDSEDHVQVYYTTHSGLSTGSWSTPTQLTGTSDEEPIEHMACILRNLAGDRLYILYSSMSDGIGYNVLQSDDFGSTWTRYNILPIAMGPVERSVYNIDHPAWESTNDLYILFHNVLQDSNTILTRNPIYVFHWDATEGARFPSGIGASTGKMSSWDDVQINSINGQVFLRSGEGITLTTGTSTTGLDLATQNITFLGSGDDIETAITNAAAGDAIILAAGTYTITTAIDISKAINLYGAGRKATTINLATNDINAINITANSVSISDLSITTSHNSTSAHMAIDVDGTSSDISGILVQRTDITMTGTGTGTKTAIRARDTDVTLRDMNINVTNTQGPVRAVYAFSAASTSNQMDVNIYNSTINSTAQATNSVAVGSEESSATQDCIVSVYNSVLTARESAASVASDAVRAALGTNAILNVYDSTLDGTDSDATQASNAILRIHNSEFVNGGKVSGTINYLGSAATKNMIVDNQLTVTGTIVTWSDITSSDTGDLGWAVVDGTDNNACTTQCTSAAVFGLNLSAGATAPNMVGPNDATADICLCAGGS